LASQKQRLAKKGKLKQKLKGMAEILGSTQFAICVCCSSETDERSLIPNYFMIDTFSFVIQQPLFNLQP